MLKAWDLVERNKLNVNKKKKLFAFQTVRQQNANISYVASQQAYNQSAQNKIAFLQSSSSGLNDVNAAQKNINLALIQGSRSSKTFNDAKSAFEIALNRFNDAQKLLNDAEKAYIDPKAKFFDAEANLRGANTAKNFAFGEYLNTALAL